VGLGLSGVFALLERGQGVGFQAVQIKHSTIFFLVYALMHANLKLLDGVQSG
jgi:hypothetical protein